MPVPRLLVYPLLFASLILSTVLLSAQGAPPRQASAPAAAEPLPVRRVVLYKTGVGYFEHLGSVRGAQDIAIRFTSAQLNDVLKSLTAIDLGQGQVTSISYNSIAPPEQRLAALRLPLGQQSTMADLLRSLRGARIEVTSGAASVSGRLLSVEARTARDGDVAREVTTFSIVSDAGEMRTFELSPAIRVRLAERELRDELGRYLDIVGSTREQDVRSMVISTNGTGERRLFVSYISEVPIWKSSYRLVFPDTGNPLLQGWAIIDNTIGEDWRNVELSLVAGAPQSFIQQLSQPYYGQRPEVPMPRNVLLEPQTHGGTLRIGRGMVSGVVRDAMGAVIPGATIELHAADGDAISARTDAGGRFEVIAPAGAYSLRATLAGFRAAVADVHVPAGGSTTQDLTLHVGAINEAVNLTADGLVSRRGTPPPPPPAPEAAPSLSSGMGFQQLKETAPAAMATDLGELLEYRIKEPVTLQKNQSALVPIVSSEIQAERVSLWNGKSGTGRPRRAMWLTNTTGLALDGGSMTIIDGNIFAGEGLIEPLEPSARRLVSYAADLAVLVEAVTRPVPVRLQRLLIRDGIITRETETRSTTIYTAKNEGTDPVTLIVEHAVRPGWKLTAGHTPVESTAGAERFRVIVGPTQDATLSVTEASPAASRVSVADATDTLVAELAASGIPAADLERVLRPVLTQRMEVARLDRQLGEIDAERKRIVDDQQRLRENMKALRASSEERQLLQRYTRQLDEQENRLATLQAERTRVLQERTVAMADLTRLVNAVTFEWSAK